MSDVFGWIGGAELMLVAIAALLLFAEELRGFADKGLDWILGGRRRR